MSKLTVLFCLPMTAFLINAASGCPPGEVFQSCGSDCYETCENLGLIGPCPPVCVEGCFCPHGYVRASKEPGAKCIPRSQCCPQGEVFQSCGSACPVTCENLDQILPCPPVCVEGCFCRDGYVLASKEPWARCIPRSQC